MLLVPISRGAAAMLCDEACVRTAADRLPAVEPQPFDAAELCVTCFACGLTIPGIRCLCAETGLSCGRTSWLLTVQPHAAMDAIFAACGPTLLTDADWEFLLDRAEEVDTGGLAGFLWVRERRLKPES